jgi:hypothetical protein
MMKPISGLLTLLVLLHCANSCNARWTTPGGKAGEERKALEEKMRQFQVDNPHLDAADMNTELNVIRKDAAAEQAEKDRKTRERNLENSRDPLKVSSGLTSVVMDEVCS